MRRLSIRLVSECCFVRYNVIVLRSFRKVFRRLIYYYKGQWEIVNKLQGKGKERKGNERI